MPREPRFWLAGAGRAVTESPHADTNAELCAVFLLSHQLPVIQPHMADQEVVQCCWSRLRRLVGLSFASQRPPIPPVPITNLRHGDSRQFRCQLTCGL